MKLKPKKEKQEKSLYDSSIDGSITDSDEDEADLRLNKNDKQPLFNDEEILDIEEAQDKNIFDDV